MLGCEVWFAISYFIDIYSVAKECLIWTDAVRSGVCFVVSEKELGDRSDETYEAGMVDRVLLQCAKAAW